jgi:hypothetical protein
MCCLLTVEGPQVILSLCFCHISSISAHFQKMGIGPRKCSDLYVKRLNNCVDIFSCSHIKLSLFYFSSLLSSPPPPFSQLLYLSSTSYTTLLPQAPMGMLILQALLRAHIQNQQVSNPLHKGTCIYTNPYLASWMAIL